jgi:hypothetical protein
VPSAWSECSPHCASATASACEAGRPPERLVQAINDYSRELAHVRAGLPPTFLAREAAAVAALPVNAGDQRRRGAAMTVSAYATRARAGSPGCRDAADRPAYDIGAPVYCEDRPVGKLGRVVVDLIRRAVTHLTVSAG